MGRLFKENFGLVMFFQLPCLPLSLLMDAFDLISIIDVHLIHEQVDHNSYNVFKLFFIFLVIVLNQFSINSALAYSMFVTVSL